MKAPIIRPSVRNNKELTILDCSGEFSTLDLSENTKLTCLVCHANLSRLDVGRNTELTYLNCNDNKLIFLDVRPNTRLISLSYGNFFSDGNKLTAVDVGGLTELKELDCRNIPALTTLNVS